MSESKKRLTDRTFSRKVSEAASIVQEVLGFHVDGLDTINDKGVQKLTKQADEATVQNKRAREAAKQFKRLFHSQVALTKIAGDVVRNGLDAIKSIRRENAKTVKHLAKTKSDVRIIDEKTSKAIDVIEYGTNKEITHIGEAANAAKSVIDARYTSLSKFTQAQASEQKAEIGSRSQKRLGSLSKPWRN